MRNFLLTILISLMTFGFSSCVSSQTLYADYQKVYFDHVIYGHIISNDYVWDGTYSYHILGEVPRNVYWELYPLRHDVYIYSKNMIRIRLYEYTRRSIYYNRTHHNYYKFDDRHRPPIKPDNRYPIDRQGFIPQQKKPQENISNRNIIPQNKNNRNIIQQGRQPLQNNRPHIPNRSNTIQRGRR